VTIGNIEDEEFFSVKSSLFIYRHLGQPRKNKDPRCSSNISHSCGILLQGQKPPIPPLIAVYKLQVLIRVEYFPVRLTSHSLTHSLCFSGARMNYLQEGTGSTVGKYSHKH